MPVVNGVVTVMPAPEGYVIDFDHPQRQGVPEAYWIAGVGGFFAILFMAQRLYTKVFLTGGLMLDDGKNMFSNYPWMSIPSNRGVPRRGG